MASTYALIVAAGRGTRFGGTLPKQYLALGGGTVLRHAGSSCAGHSRISGVMVVIRPEDRAAFDRAVAGHMFLPPVPGGPERQDSVRLGLEALAEHKPQRVLIHDGARPFPIPDLIDRVLDGLDRAPAAIPALPLGATIKRVEEGHIRETIDRSQLWRAQTPQGFHFEPIPMGPTAYAATLVRERGGAVAAVDVTIICERPKIAPYRDRMVERLAEILEISPGRVSVKATTTEKLGFAGRGEGIAAQAVATIRLPL